MKSANPGAPWPSCDVVESFDNFERSSVLPRGLEECGDPDGEDAAGSECDVDGVAVHVEEETVDECEVARL